MASKSDKLQVAGRVQINFKCTWTIPHFSSLDTLVGKSHKSEVFKLDDDDIEWYLFVYPGGNSANEGYVSCFLCTNNLPVSECKFRISFFNTDYEVLYDEGYNDWRTIPTTGLGYNQTIKPEVLKRKLINDTLLVILDATYCVTPVKDCVSIYHCEEVTPMLKVTDDLKNLWISKNHSDLIISVREKDISVHLAVLCARSEVFSAMFEHDTKEKTTRRVEVTDFEVDTMLSFMEYIYSGGVSDMNFDLALELLRASDKYGVSDLKLYCYNFLKSILNLENVCQVLLSAHIHNAEKLRSHAIEYLCKNVSIEKFHSQRVSFETHPKLLCDIIEGMIKRS